jgi:hypothetical protein
MMTTVDPITMLTPRTFLRHFSGARVTAIPTPFGPDRAQQVRSLAKTSVGPIADAYEQYMTDGEMAYVAAVWGAMPDHCAWNDAFCQIARGAA